MSSVRLSTCGSVAGQTTYSNAKVQSCKTSSTKVSDWICEILCDQMATVLWRVSILVIDKMDVKYFFLLYHKIDITMNTSSFQCQIML